MPLPKQNIPESSKTEKWSKLNVDQIIMMSDDNDYEREKDIFCYNLVQNKMNKENFDYLVKVESFEYPAEVRFIPILRPKVDLMVSEQQERPFSFRVFTMDQLSLEKKQDDMMNMVVEYIMSKALSKYYTVSQNQEFIEQQLRQFAVAKQQQEQAFMQQMQQGQQPDQEPMVVPIEFNVAKDIMKARNLVSRKEVEEIERYHRFERQDFVEIIMQKGLNTQMHEYDFESIFLKGMFDKSVTDKEFYYVDWNGHDEDPILKRINVLNAYYPNNNNTEWAGDLDWFMFEDFVPLNTLVDEFRGDLTADDMKKLDEQAVYYNDYNRSYANTFNEDTFDPDGCKPTSLYGGTTENSKTIRVCYCFWQSPRRINIKQSPNPHEEGEYFKHIVKDEEMKVGKDTYKFRYVNDVYMGIRAGKDVYLRCGKKPVQLRKQDKIGKVELPIVGMTFNNVDRVPYSMVWAGKDIQILYNLIHFHLELWLALSGVKGFIMDKSQIPEGMTMKEWVYQRRMGTGWIQTMKKGQARPQFNQFQTYDDSLPASVQYLQGILEHLENLLDKITGVSRQREGITKEQDQVGSNERSVYQSSLVTQKRHHEHEKIKQKALERYVNLCAKAWKNGKSGQYVTGGLGQFMLNIPPNLVDKHDYRLHVKDSAKEDRKMKRFEEIISAEYQKQAISAPQMAKLFQMDTLTEMEKSLEYFTDKAQELAQLANQAEKDHENQKIQAEQQGKAQIEEMKGQYDIQKEQLQQEMKKFELQQEAQIKQLENGIKEAELAWERQKFDREQQLEKYEIDTKNQIEKAKLNVSLVDIGTERVMEEKQLKSNEKIAAVTEDTKRKVAAKNKVGE